MAAPRTQYTCSACNATFARWVGKCTSCGEFNTVAESGPASGKAAGTAGLKTDMRAAAVARPARRIGDINTEAHKHTPTGIGEFDRVLGGGLVAGQVLLLSGEPGVGKSTLLLEVASRYAVKGKTVLYVSGEESAEQITLRARRMGIDSANLYLADETDLSVILGHIEQVDPDLVIVDSIQTIASPNIDSRAGGVAQVNEVSVTLTRVAKARHTPFLVVAQITKDGNISGPMALSHVVDTVLFFEGDRNTSLRLLRTMKNRFGAADEVACFEQTETGLAEVPDPSGLFRTGRDEPVAGTCITVTVEGRRAMLAEVQALVAPTNAPNPRRGVSGLDSARMAMLVAVTERHGRLRLFDKDTFLATVAGMKIVEPAADLAVCLALASAANDTPVPSDVAAIGEVSLSGDIRPVSNLAQRLMEASRLGFRRVLVPVGASKPAGASDLVLIEVGHLSRALAALAAMNPKTSAA
jgi:DNA repair protein RadA/Sms